MKRTFFAIDIHPDDKMKNLLQEIKESLIGEKIKWTPWDQLHLTLKFLGDTPVQEIQNIVDAVSGQLGEIPVITLQLNSVGLFKNLRNPRIIWIGIKPCQELQLAWQCVNDNLLPFGYPAEDSEFVPHLTIGRVKAISQSEKLADIIGRSKDVSFGEMVVPEIVFYESVLKPEGPIYIPLKRFPLG